MLLLPTLLLPVLLLSVLQFKFVVDKVWTPAPHEPYVTNSEVGPRYSLGIILWA